MSKLVGRKIKAIREINDYDQQTLSSKIGCTVSALSNWENGRNNPNSVMALRLAAIGNITVEELLNDSREQAIQELIAFTREVVPNEKEKELDELIKRVGGHE